MTRMRRFIIGAAIGLAVGVYIAWPKWRGGMGQGLHSPSYVQRLADGTLQAFPKRDASGAIYTPAFDPDAIAVFAVWEPPPTRMQYDSLGRTLFLLDEYEVDVRQANILSNGGVNPPDTPAQPADVAAVLAHVGLAAKYTKLGAIYWDTVWQRVLPVLLVLATFGGICANIPFHNRKPGHCTCGYNLHGLTSDTCPECGREVSRGG